MFTDEFVSFARTLGLPVGGVLVGLVLGAIAFATLDWLARRPASGAVTEGGVRRVDAPPTPGAPGAGRPTPEVTVVGTDGTRTVLLQGAGASPNAPLPRARGYLAVIVGTFAILSALQLAFFARLYAPYDQLVAYAGTVLFWPTAWPGVYAVASTAQLVPDYIFPMYLAAVAAVALAGGLFYRRPALPPNRGWWALAIVLVYIGVEIVIDAVFFTVPGQNFRNLAIVVRTLAGGVFLALVVLCTVCLPAPRAMRPRFRRDPAAIRQFAWTAAASIGVAVTVLVLLDSLLGFESILLPFTLLLVLPLVTLESFVALNRPLYFRQLRRRPLPPLSKYHPSVSIVMPAYNEAEWISNAIRLADLAAAKYPGPVEIIVGNDGSKDATSALAKEAVGRLRHSKGMVVDLPHAGKSNALNGALALATGDIVIRLDADTFVSPSYGFGAMVRHFADPEVGGVQGSIVPRQKSGWTRKLRAMEIAWGHFFQRPALMGVRSGEVIDGLFSAFRRKDLVALGGWVPWNGEDTEISMRVQRLGYRVRMEFGARAYEDVPPNYASLRRQRVRWARGILMANGQHYPALMGATPEFAGLGILFWFLTFARSGVRSLVYIFLGLLFLVGVHAIIDVAFLLVLALAIRAVPLSYFLVKMGRADTLPWVPFFPIANIIKQSFRFEAFGLLGPEAQREYA